MEESTLTEAGRISYSWPAQKVIEIMEIFLWSISEMGTSGKTSLDSLFHIV